MASLKACLGLLVWVFFFFVGIIYATIGLEGSMCYYLIGDNMLDNRCLMNVDMGMLIY